MPSPTRTPPLLFPVACSPASTATPKRQVYLHSRNPSPNCATEIDDSLAVQGDAYTERDDGHILYALGYLTTPARIAEAATQRGFGVCGDPELTVHAFLRRLENATGVCEGNGLMEVRMAGEGAGGSTNCAQSGGHSTRVGGDGEQVEVVWLILVKGLSPRVEDMVVPDILLQRFQESMPTDEMPALYRIAARGGGEGKVKTEKAPTPSPPMICHCPRRSRLVLGYVTNPRALYRQALRTGTAIPGDFAATLERILRRIRRLTGRALSDTVLKLSDGGWLLIVADAADLGGEQGTATALEGQIAGMAGFTPGTTGQLAGQEATLDALYARCSEASICAFQRMVGTKEAPGAYNCDFPCVSGSVDCGDRGGFR
ncbi:uncharacterized protein SCHCODRAFT_02136512 [Schizophyllum commune H4-8]|uniref:uncharacterized protein n=1 Tax=Schizophyllum commune (strain H4-8 / FGSC 9210) TaxID=578458 RepID=UPI002160BE41|nr:uncharacterized protein SCHCODRAFT_02136512 [Schizophyllum commune H4-8]KAI5884884.1 hypothetical protein SCHCODRAFT_02136512 [Schizophyllum commune H4-8]